MPKHNDHNGKTILLSAECWQGALKACRFAGKFLYDQESNFVLFQTYQTPSFGTTTMRNLDPILKKIAREDLTTLKDQLIGEFGIPSEKIEKIVVEGEFEDLLNEIAGKYSDNALVIGSDFDQPFRADACGKSIQKLLQSSVRPIILVTGNIVIIQERGTIIICPGEETLSEDFLNFFQEKDNAAKEPLVIITKDNNKHINLEPTVGKYFTKITGNGEIRYSQAEKLLNERILV